MSGRVYPASVMAREIERLQEKKSLRIDGVAITPPPQPTLGRSMYAGVLDDADNWDARWPPPSDPVRFDPGTIVRHQESGHLAEVVDWTSTWNGRYREVTYRLRWLTVDWCDASWTGKAFVQAIPLEALAAQGL